MSWVPVESELPRPLIDVLVVHELFKEHTTDFAYLKPDGRWVLTGSDPDQDVHPSHWMHVPALPAELEDAA